MSSALPQATNDGTVAVTEESKNPQEHGWVAKTSYDYETYNKSTKELAEAKTATGEEAAPAAVELAHGEWAGNAAIYQWDDEFGDVGPKFPALEEQLFGQGANRSRVGIKFDK